MTPGREGHLGQLRERRRRMVPVELDRLRWIAVVLPVAFILIMEAMRLLLVEGDSTQQNGHLALAAMMLIGAVTFALVMFLGIEATQRQLVRQNHELAAVGRILEKSYRDIPNTAQEAGPFVHFGVVGDDGSELRGTLHLPLTVPAGCCPQILLNAPLP